MIQMEGQRGSDLGVSNGLFRVYTYAGESDHRIVNVGLAECRHSGGLSENLTHPSTGETSSPKILADTAEIEPVGLSAITEVESLASVQPIVSTHPKLLWILGFDR